MGIQHCYEQSSSEWHREWAEDDDEMEEMSDEEKEAADNAARMEIERAMDEEAWHREQEQGQMNISPLPEIEFDLDAAF